MPIRDICDTCKHRDLDEGTELPCINCCFYQVERGDYADEPQRFSLHEPRDPVETNQGEQT